MGRGGSGDCPTECEDRMLFIQREWRHKLFWLGRFVEIYSYMAPTVPQRCLLDPESIQWRASVHSDYGLALCYYNCSQQNCITWKLITKEKYHLPLLHQTCCVIICILTWFLFTLKLRESLGYWIVLGGGS